MSHDISVLHEAIERSEDRTADHEEEAEEQESTEKCQQDGQRASIGEVVLGLCDVCAKERLGVERGFFPGCTAISEGIDDDHATDRIQRRLNIVSSEGLAIIVCEVVDNNCLCLLYTSPSPRDQRGSRMPSAA